MELRRPLSRHKTASIVNTLIDTGAHLALPAAVHMIQNQVTRIAPNIKAYQNAVNKSFLSGISGRPLTKTHTATVGAGAVLSPESKILHDEMGYAGKMVASKLKEQGLRFSKLPLVHKQIIQAMGEGDFTKVDTLVKATKHGGLIKKVVSESVDPYLKKRGLPSLDTLKDPKLQRIYQNSHIGKTTKAAFNMSNASSIIPKLPYKSRDAGLVGEGVATGLLGYYIDPLTAVVNAGKRLSTSKAVGNAMPVIKPLQKKVKDIIMVDPSRKAYEKGRSVGFKVDPMWKRILKRDVVNPVAYDTAEHAGHAGNRIRQLES